jgi:Flp pilus assembly protein TadD
VREESAAVNAAASDPTAALRDLATAADLDPLSPVPGRLGGRIALQAGYYQTAEQRFAQAIGREPGGWFAWFGDGLAASQLGDVERARRDFTVALRIERYQPVIASALSRVGTHRPVTPAEGLRRIVLAQ